MRAIVTAIVFFKQRTVCIIIVGAVRKSCPSWFGGVTGLGLFELPAAG